MTSWKQFSRVEKNANKVTQVYFYVTCYFSFALNVNAIFD